MAKRYVMVNELKPECREEYIHAHEKMHESIWKEQLDVLKKAGATECICYIFGNYAILIYECDDIVESFQELAKDPRRGAWEEYMGPMFAGTPKFDGSDEVPYLKKIFDMNQQLDGELKQF